MNVLFQPLQLGSLSLPNRIVMAPLTRARSGPDRIPNDLMAEYYGQRASAGLILSEATSVHPMGVGYVNTPGIWSAEQIVGWKKVTHAVHQKGGRIFLQLWHVGRISHSSLLNGHQPVAPSAIKPKGHVSLLRPVTEYEVPRELGINEIKEIVESYRQGAENAKKAGFDGVEIHAANGYLIDQFLQDGSNRREDIYGGPIANRVRFLLEVTDAVISVWGADRVGVHLAPRGDSHDMGDSDRLRLFSFVVEQLSRRQIAFICTREYQAEDSLSPQLKKLFSGAFIANEKLSQDAALQLIESGRADAVAFGKAYIANPDLVKRFRLDAPLNTPIPEAFYGNSREGYIDYPTI